MRNPVANADEPVSILLVEDNEAHAEFIMRCLEEHPTRNCVTHISDGESALNYLLRRGVYEDPETSPRPRLMLLDLRLPRVSGLEVLRELRARDELRRLPVVILTTSDAERDVARAYEAQANGYVVKPADFEAFSRLINDLGTFWLSWNHCPDR